MADKRPTPATAPHCFICGGPYAAPDGTPRFCEYCPGVTGDEVTSLPPLPQVEPAEAAVFRGTACVAPAAAHLPAALARGPHRRPLLVPVFEEPAVSRLPLRTYRLFWLAVLIAGLVVTSIVLVVAR